MVNGEKLQLAGRLVTSGQHSDSLFPRVSQGFPKGFQGFPKCLHCMGLESLWAIVVHIATPVRSCKSSCCAASHLHVSSIKEHVTVQPVRGFVTQTNKNKAYPSKAAYIVFQFCLHVHGVACNQQLALTRLAGLEREDKLRCTFRQGRSHPIFGCSPSRV